MRVTLLRPPVLMPTFNMATIIVPPLGLAYVASSLRKAGHEVSLIDSVGLKIEQFTQHDGAWLHGLTLDEAVERIPDDTDCIGVSVQFSYEWPVGRALLGKIRSRFPKTLLIGGGEHVTALPELCVRDGLLDIAILGEGETTACRLFQVIEGNGLEGLEDVPGILYRAADGSLKRTTPVKRIADLENIPCPAWELVPMEAYLSRGYGFGVNRGRSVPVLASRGCPYQCTFCSNPMMWTTKWQARDTGDLLDEIAYLQRTYRADNFDFYDLTMIVKKQWIVDFCLAIERRKMSFTWQLPSGTRSEAIDEEVSRLMYRTGCRNVSYAPESGSVETLRIIKKKVSLTHMIKSMRAAVKNGLNVKYNMILGFPRDRWRNLLESLVFIAKTAVIGVHDVSMWVFAPYPGSELFQRLMQEGKIPELTDKFFYRLAAYADISATYSYCDRLSKRELLFARVVGIVWFYLISWAIRPWRPFQMLWHLITGHFESRSEMVLQGLVGRIERLIHTQIAYLSKRFTGSRQTI